MSANTRTEVGTEIQLEGARLVIVERIEDGSGLYIAKDNKRSMYLLNKVPDTGEWKLHVPESMRLNVLT